MSSTIPAERHTIRIANGSLYLDNTLYETYFHSIDSVILLNKPPNILIMPVQQSGAGGLLMKIRNSAGDRVVSIVDFLENYGFKLQEEVIIPVIWSRADAALTFDNTFSKLKSEVRNRSV